DDSTRFWYRVKTRRGAEFMLVDPVHLTRRPLFDNDRLAAALSVAADTAFEPTKLPFKTFKFGATPTGISFKAGNCYYQCHLSASHCVKGDPVSADPPDWAAKSPDRKWAAYVRKGNVWIKRVGTKDSVQLTTDGEAEQPYGLDASDMDLPDPDAR